MTDAWGCENKPGEPANARRVAEPWFLKWMIIRGDRVIAAVLPLKLELQHDGTNLH